MASRWRRLGLFASVVVLSGITATVPPAQAAPVNNVGEAVTIKEPNPQPRIPAPVTVPRKGTKVAPMRSVPTPTVPKAASGMTVGKGLALDPGKAQGVRRVERATGPKAANPYAPNAGPDDPPGGLFCSPYLSWNTSVNRDPNNYSTTTSIYGEVYCNFYLDYVYVSVGVYDHTPGFEGWLYWSNPTQAYGSYYATNNGLLTIFGDYYDGGRNLEVVIEMYLLTPYGIPWGGCFEVPGLRYFACDGVYTDFLHSALGGYPFGSGLDPAVVRYTALGDSYSSGTGAPPYYAAVDPVICRRSISTYAYYLSGGVRSGQPPVDTPNLRACHGAVIDDFYGEQHGYVPRQLYQVRPFDRLATVTISGNDVGFTEGLSRCIFGNCVTDGIPLVTPEFLGLTQTRLIRLYQNILGQMRSDGILVVASYPAVLPNPKDGADPLPTFSQCPIVNAQIDKKELEAIYDATKALDQMIQGAAAAVGPRVVFVDLLDAFRGRRICSGAATAYGRDIELANIPESIHPTALGYAEMGRQIRQTVGLF